MPGFFKAALTAFAILGCAVVVMLGTLTAYWGYTMTAGHGEGEALAFILMGGGAVVALGGGLSLHLLLRQPRRNETLTDEGW